MSTPDEATSDLDTVRERLNVVTQETRFSLVQGILGHPSGLPTLKELDYVNPSRSQTTIRQHLQRPVDAGIVEKVELPEDRRQNDLPYTFYGISDEGRLFLEDHRLLRAEETLRTIYDQVEKTDEIERYEITPRPGPWPTRGNIEDAQVALDPDGRAVRLLRALADDPGQTLAYDDLYELEGDVEKSAVRQHIGNLRDLNLIDTFTTSEGKMAELLTAGEEFLGRTDTEIDRQQSLEECVSSPGQNDTQAVLPGEHGEEGGRPTKDPRERPMPTQPVCPTARRTSTGQLTQRRRRQPTPGAFRS